MLFNEYIYILIYFLVVLIVCFIIFLLSIVFDLFFFKYQKDFEKNKAYECGFQPFSDARFNFDIRFYLIAILFIIFDLEVTFLIPWSITFQSITSFSYLIVYVFIYVLIIGFFYEWFKGALDWQ